jgi:signal transduction histidine kinase
MFVSITIAYMILDQVMMSYLSDAERETYTRLDDRMTELDPVGGGQFVILLFTVIGSLAARRITQPITNVAEVTQRVVKGGLSASAVLPPRQKGREIGALVENVNALLDVAQTSNDRVKTDAFAIAHQLRTPVTALQMKLHGMIDGVVPASDEELQRLLVQTQVLSRVIEDLRMLSLASQGELMLIKAPTNLLTLARSVLALHVKQIETAGIVAQASGQNVVTHVDPDRLRQALSNLIENVVRYASDGASHDITVSQSAGICEIKVSDRGDGLSVSFRAVVFEQFQREDASRFREYGG